MDAYDYIMIVPPGYKYRALWSDDAAPPRHPKRRQSDVTSKGQPIADLQRTLGHAEYSRCTGESWEEWSRRTHPVAPDTIQKGEPDDPC